MHLDPTEEQSLIEQTARDFAQRELAPAAAARDRDGTFPGRELRELGKLGLLGVSIPEALGGSAAGAIAYSLALQELAYADPSVAVHVSVTNMVGELIATHGTDAQRKRYVPLLCSGEAICGAFALSEPEVGSDPSALRTSARQVDAGWIVSGTKQWVTGGDHAGVSVVWAVTDPGQGHRGISAFLVDGGTAGVKVARVEDKLGLRGSSTCQIVLDDARLGADALLGKRGVGFKLAMMALDAGRIAIASQACGVAQFALDRAIAYAKERQTFGQPIIQHQAVGAMLADCATWLSAARWLTLRAAWLKEQGKPFSREASMAKLLASERASQICDIAIQIHGGYGYTRDFPVERAWRDARVTRLYEGTSEIQRLVIARSLFKEANP
jgi:alkylation response protein AidB-like acyl-CoA dehydrogenase